MASTVRHSLMTGANLHEPKGVAAAANGTMATAQSGAIVWTDDITPDTLSLKTAVYRSIACPLLSCGAGAGRIPTLTKFKDDGSGSAGVYCYGFSPIEIEDLHTHFQLPHGYVAASNLLPVIKWCPTSTNTGVVRWGLEYTVVDLLGTFGNTTTVYIEDAGDGTAYKHQVASFAAIVGTGLTKNSILVCRFFRDATHANDTYTGTAIGLCLNFDIQIAAFGTATEF